MKNDIMAILASTFLFGVFLIGCSSPDKKVENAREDVSNEQEDLKEAKQDLKTAETKQDSIAEYNIFKAGAEAQLSQNEKMIAELRAVNSKENNKEYRENHKKAIDKLEQRNKDLKDKLVKRDRSNSNTKWENFKTEFNHDIDELGLALKDFTVNNKKDKM